MTKGFVRKAEKAGYKAIVVTVDRPEQGFRRSSHRNKFSLPSHLKYVSPPLHLNKVGPNVWLIAGSVIMCDKRMEGGVGGEEKKEKRKI